MEQLIVKRSAWNRGKSLGELYNGRTGQCCIMGFYLKGHGISTEEMNGVDTPASLFARIGFRETPIRLATNESVGKFWDTSWTKDVMGTNDNSRIEDPERERLLIRRFAQWECTLTFID